MSENISAILPKLIEISKIDLKYALALSEKNKLNDSLKEQAAKLKLLESDYTAKSAEHSEKEASYQKQEKYLKAEQEKLVERRKSLRSINDHKIQTKAEKEIEHAAKQLAVMEEQLIGLLDSIESLSVASNESKAAFDQFQEESSKANEDTNEALKNVEERLNEHESTRKELEGGLEPRLLNTYKIISERYPGEAVVAIKDNACSGCFFSLGPQVIVQVAREDKIVNCPTCGRILYLPKNEEAEESKE